MSDKPIDLEARRRKARAQKQAPEIRAGTREEWRRLAPYNPEWKGVAAGEWRKEGDIRDDGLPADCPVTPLGYDEEAVYYLTARDTIAKLPAKMGKGDVDLLFMPCSAFPVWAWPRRNKEGVVLGNFNAEEARQDLFDAAFVPGPWDPLEQVRGRGAWRDDETGGLILHLGEGLLTGNGPRHLGVRGRHVYPARAGIPAPAPSAAIDADMGERGPGHALMTFLETWEWVRGDVDARLMLGWLACAFVGGALRWRPYVFLTGDAGAGKSTLLELVEHAIGEGGLLKSEDATEAGIAQTLGHDALPVLLDEMENELDGRRASNIVKMARRASSGSQRIRGGQDHKSASFVIRSCFLFAAINPPTLDDQDVSRMALLSMRPFRDGTPRRRFDVREIAALGRAMHRQVVDWFAIDEDRGVPRFEIMLEIFREALIEEGGHSDRGADTFGYLMAGYWSATEYELPDPAIVSELIRPLYKDELAEYENMKPTWRKCLDYLLACQPRALERQAQTSVLQILEHWRDAENRPVSMLGEDPGAGMVDWKDVNRKLSRVGLSVKFAKGQSRQFINAQLFVPNSHPALAPVFNDTNWRTQNPALPGQWGPALLGAPHEIAWRDKRDQGRTRGVAVALQKVMRVTTPKDDEDEDGED